MARNTRNYPRGDEESLRDTVKKLRSQLRNLKKENKELKSENATLLDAWSKTEAFLAEVTEGIDVEELLQYKKLPKKAVGRPKKQESDKQDALEYWQKWRKDNL